MGVGVGVVGVGGARETCFENELKGDVASVCVCVCCGCMCLSVCHLPSSVSVDSSVDLRRCPKLAVSPGLAWPAAGETRFLSHM